MELYLTGFVVLVMVLVVIHQTILFHVERRRMAQENKDLLNRLMSRDFTAYAAGSVAMSTAYAAQHVGDGRAGDTGRDAGVSAGRRTDR